MPLRHIRALVRKWPLAAFLRRRARGKPAPAQQAASEARLRKLIDNAWDLLLLFDRDMRVLYASPSVERLLGRSPLGHRIAGDGLPVPAEDLARIETVLKQALTHPGVPCSFEHRLRNRSGDDLLVEASLTNLLDDADVAALVYSGREVGARRQAERALRESEARYRILFENSPLPMWLFDPDTLAILETNQTALAHYGYTREEFLAMSLRELHPALDVAALAKTLRRGAPVEIWNLRRKDGSLLQAAVRLRLTPFQGRPACLVLAENVTDRLAAEQARRESEARLRAVFDGAPVGIAIADAAGRYLMVNRELCRMLGYAEAELVGRRYTDFVCRDDAQDGIDLAALVRNGDSDVVASERRWVRKDGSTFWVLLTVSVARTTEGSFVGCVSVALDVTERREAEARRIEYARRQRDILVREVHHRIKNHLQGLLGLLRQYIDEQPALAPPLRKLAAQINAITIVHGLQGRGKGAAGLPELAAEIAGFLGGLTGGRILIDCPQRDCPWAVAESEAVPLALVLNELLTNALRHGTDKSDVSLRIACHAKGARLTIDNPGRLDAGFDFAAGKGLGTGLELVRSLLPHEGATLRLANGRQGRVEASLELAPPVLLPATASHAVSLR
jgi:PAS domain S-box-containing protein